MTFPIRPTTDAEARQLWATPWWLIGWLESVTGQPILLDVASEEWSAKAERWLGPGGVEENALSVTCDWRALAGGGGFPHVWLNPPYGRIEPWVDAAIRQASTGRLVIWLLVPMRTDQAWCARAMEAGPVTLLTGSPRVGFTPPPGIEASTPMGSPVLFQFGVGRWLPRSVDVREARALGTAYVAAVPRLRELRDHRAALRAEGLDRVGGSGNSTAGDVVDLFGVGG